MIHLLNSILLPSRMTMVRYWAFSMLIEVVRRLNLLKLVCLLHLQKQVLLIRFIHSTVGIPIWMLLLSVRLLLLLPILKQQDSILFSMLLKVKWFSLRLLMFIAPLNIQAIPQQRQVWNLLIFGICLVVGILKLLILPQI